ncbi:phBC6A51 family helix-turn-helix protein [Rossellomorea aquimaris]|uniref:phBC6A51 family helix-turn-helix protein n=1 Tax=Rossellomorea aquimaris TaxID=189382 RepID=UPI001CFEA719|nr:phBC6A51 family helix-turn-helix protein [Rossellomorea aquimaris]
MSKLKTEQLNAIKWLAQPKQGGLNHEQIAEQVGVSRQTLYRWRQDRAFQDELKREVARSVMDDIPNVIASLKKQATKEVQPSVKAAELLLKSVSMLNDRLEIEDRSKASSTPSDDIDRMKAEIERMRAARDK